MIGWAKAEAFCLAVEVVLKGRDLSSKSKSLWRLQFSNVFSCFGAPFTVCWGFLKGTLSGWLYERPECLDYVHHQAPLVLANKESFLAFFVSATCDFVARFLTVLMPFLWLNIENLRCSTIWTFVTQKQSGLIQHLSFKTCQGTCGACYMFAALDSLSDRHCIDTTKVLRGRSFGLQVVSRLLGMWTQIHHMELFLLARKRARFRCRWKRYQGRDFVS